jgi:hypothetical protein
MAAFYSLLNAAAGLWQSLAAVPANPIQSSRHSLVSRSADYESVVLRH